jgi:hypothetical protein
VDWMKRDEISRAGVVLAYRDGVKQLARPIRRRGWIFRLTGQRQAAFPASNVNSADSSARRRPATGAILANPPEVESTKSLPSQVLRYLNSSAHYGIVVAYPTNAYSRLIAA